MMGEASGQEARTVERDGLELPAGYSVGRAVRAVYAAAFEGRNAERLAPLEWRVGVDAAERAEVPVRGLLVPFGALATRAPPMDSSGGLYVNQQIAPALPAWRADSIAAAVGAQVLDGLQGTVTFAGPGQAAPTGHDEDASTADSEVTHRAVTLTPHDYAVRVPITRRLAKQSSPSVDAWVARDLSAALVAAVDRVAFEGDDARTPALEGAYAGAVTVACDAPGFPAEDDLERLERAGLDARGLGPHAWVIGTAEWEMLRGGGRGPVQSNAGGHSIMGHAAYPYAFEKSGRVMFGAFRYLAIGLWGGVDLEVAPTAAEAAKGRVTLHAWISTDAALTAEAVARLAPAT